MQIKTTDPFRIAALKDQKTASVGEPVEKLEPCTLLVQCG
jgi:hypothetical protein